MWKKFLQDESGATAIEYGLIAALVSVAAIGALTAMGSSLETMFKPRSVAISTMRRGGGGGNRSVSHSRLS